MGELGIAQRISRRLALLAGCVALVASSATMLGSAAPASASNESFCVFVLMSPGTACGDGHYRKITRVNARSINGSLCAGAYNSSGVQVGGWTCTVEAGETSNGNYNGSLFLNGAIYNNAPGAQYTGEGLEYYNP